jgi:hypothetical protein
MDDNLDVKDTEEVQLPEEPSTSEQTTEEAEAPEVDVATETQGEEAETAESNKGYSQRVRELNAQKKAAEERAAEAEQRAQSFAERLAEMTQPIGDGGHQAPTYDPQVQAGEEITPERYQGDINQAANQIVDWRLKQERAVNKIERDATNAIKKYPELDPDNKEAFNRELSDAVTEAVEREAMITTYDRNGQMVKTVNLNANIDKFVDKLMKPYKASVAREVGQATENIAKQVSEAALRPTSVRKQEKSAQDKSLAELEAELGIVNS